MLLNSVCCVVSRVLWWFSCYYSSELIGVLLLWKNLLGECGLLGVSVGWSLVMGCGLLLVVFRCFECCWWLV